MDNIIVFQGGKGRLEEWDDHIRGTCDSLDKIIAVVAQSKKELQVAAAPAS